MARRTIPTRKGASDIDLFTEWISHLKDASKERIVFVRHKKDKDVLETLGVQNIVYYQEPEDKVIDEIVNAEKECLLIFDAHRPTNKLCERLKSELEKRGVKVSTRFRKILFTSKFKELSGLLKFLHKHVADTERKHHGVPY